MTNCVPVEAERKGNNVNKNRSNLWFFKGMQSVLTMPDLDIQTNLKN